MRTSIGYKATKFFFLFVNYKRPFKTDKRFKKYLRKKRKKNNQPYSSIFPVLKRMLFERHQIEGMDYFVCNPEGEVTILFIPGGSYIDHPTELHWLFFEKLVNRTNAKVIVPIYPKLPTYRFKDAFPPMETLYKKLGKDTILIADSAGAGIGCALWYSNPIPVFKKTIFISPWMDLFLTNPNINKQEKKDPILSVTGLRRLGELWADSSEELANPMMGESSIITNLLVFSGTNEIFLEDIRDFVSRCNPNEVTYFEYPGMNHGFVIHPIKEAKSAVEKIINFINNKSDGFN